VPVSSVCQDGDQQIVVVGQEAAGISAYYGCVRTHYLCVPTYPAYPKPTYLSTYPTYPPTYRLGFLRRTLEPTLWATSASS
jgi:hypothetical protein